MMNITLKTLAPMIATSRIRANRVGNIITISTARWTRVSSQPPV